MKKFQLFILSFLTCFVCYAQGGYAFRLQSNSNFGTAYVLANNTPATGILSTTVKATGTASNYLIEWDSYANKWTNTNTPKNTEMTLTWGTSRPDGSLTGSFLNNKYYTLNVRGLSYSNRQAAIMETDNTPIDISAIPRSPIGTVSREQDVIVSVNLSGNKSSQERAFVRYSTTSNFITSFVSEVSFASGTASSGTAIIPSSFNTAGTTVYYYAYTSTVAATNTSDHDLISLKISGTPASYTVTNSYITTANGNWSDGTTWAGGAVPPADASIVIDHNVVLNQDASVSAVSINSGKTFTASDASPRTLTIISNTSATTLTVNGTFAPGAGGSTVYFSGSPSVSDAIQIVSGSLAFNNVTIGKSGGTTNLGVNFGSSTIAGSLQIDNGGFVSAAPANFYQASASLVFNNSGGYNINSGDITWPSVNSPNNIFIKSGNVNLNRDRSADGNLTINGGNFSIANAIVLSIKGNWLRTAGSFTANQSTVVLNGTSPQTIQGAGGSVLYNLTVSNSAGVSLNSNLSVTNVLSITSGKLSIGSNTATLNGSFSGSETHSFIGSSLSNLTIGSTYSGGTLFFSAAGEENYLNSLTANASVTLGNTLNIAPSINATTGYIKVNSGTFNSAGYLVLKSTATGTARVAESTGNISGNVTVERFISSKEDKRGWRWLTVPLANANSIRDAWQIGGGDNYIQGKGTHITGPGGLNGLDAGNTYSMRRYDPTTNSNLNVTSTLGKISDYDCYFIFIRGDRKPSNLTPSSANSTTLSATGTLKTGTQTVTAAGGANLSLNMFVGNPYASPVDFSKLGLSNVDERFWAFNPYQGDGAYVLLDGKDGYVNLLDNDFEQTVNIQSGQAILVKRITRANPSSVIFEEQDKSATNTPNVFRGNSGVIASLTSSLYRVNGATSSYVDGVSSRYNADYSAAVNAEDAPKVNNLGENLAIARDGSNLTIERRPEITGDDTIFLQLWNTTIRNYQLKFTPANFVTPGVSAFLEDSYLKTSTPVSTSDITFVPFSVTSDVNSSAINRFRIVFKTNAVLPLNFTNVKAYQKGNDIQVEWNLGNESSISRYEVEKSADGRTFTKAAAQAIRAITGSSQPYNWLDASANSGNNFYRIKAIEQNGQYKYSQVVNVKLGNTNGGISVYPNPVKGSNMSLQFVNQPKGKYAIQLFNNLGQEVYRTEFNHIGGSATQTIQLNNQVAKGIYQLQVINGDTKITSKVILE
jgi:hypothetical protein